MSGTPEPSIALILDVVCEETSHTLGQLRSPSRRADLALARKLAMWLIIKLTSATSVQIGAALGGRDKHTVTDAIKSFRAVLAGNEELAALADGLLISLGALARRPDLAARETADPLVVARGIVEAERPERRALSTPTDAVVLLADRLCQLDRLAQAAAAYLADRAAADTHDALAERLAALGYVTLSHEEKTDGNAG